MLAEDIAADIDVPPFANSSIDGYAVRAADTAGAGEETPRTLRVVGNVAAGYLAGVSVGDGEALRIMTGAPLPAGADAVIRFEDTSEAREGPLVGGQGYDRATRDAKHKAQMSSPVLLYASVQVGRCAALGRRGHAPWPGRAWQGAMIRPFEVALLAAAGRAQVLTHRRPRVAILSTGDELVDVGAPVGPGEICNSNSYGLAAQVLRPVVCPSYSASRVIRAELTRSVEEGLAHLPDLFVTSAGVSVGDYDVVKDVLDREGTMHFWRVRMKPGKPLAFGTIRGVPLLGLPGNPVSALVSMEQFGRPAIRKMLGYPPRLRPTLTCVCMSPSPTRRAASFIPGRRHRNAAGEYEARTSGEQGSGMLTSLTRANAMLVVEETRTLVQAGETVRAIMLDWPEEVF